MHITRNDILERDLIGETFEAGTYECIVLAGTLAGPFTATTISFVRGISTSSDVQVDHVVAWSDAWQKGAQQLAPNQRQAFANDPLNLLAVDGPTNASKGDGDAATWLPPNRGFWCEYVALQTAVKAKHDLWMTQAEHDAIAGILTSKCPNQPVPADNGGVAVPIAATPAPVQEEPPAPEPPPAAPAAPGSVYYENCSAAEAAGAAPVYRGDPSYGSHLDGDGDGSACE
ncbi:GmrSD restriction endonuclease domain-containing protein [Arthrobacter pigmenti]